MVQGTVLRTRPAIQGNTAKEQGTAGIIKAKLQTMELPYHYQYGRANRSMPAGRSRPRPLILAPELLSAVIFPPAPLGPGSFICLPIHLGSIGSESTRVDRAVAVQRTGATQHDGENYKIQTITSLDVPLYNTSYRGNQVLALRVIFGDSATLAGVS